ncbi:MAG: hypothetical protein AAF630_06680 [Cyanobacteria bacterium P01_C01_bin.38]
MSINVIPNFSPIILLERFLLGSTEIKTHRHKYFRHSAELPDTHFFCLSPDDSSVNGVGVCHFGRCE